MNICMPLRTGVVTRIQISLGLLAIGTWDVPSSKTSEDSETSLPQCRTRGFYFLQQSPMNCYLSNLCCNSVIIFILLRLFMYSFIYYCAM